MNSLAITIFSRKKLNTYGVESSCECLPRVGSFLANPGLSKEQLVPSCVVITFVMMDSFMETLAQYLRRCAFFDFISFKRESRRKGSLQIDEPHRGSAFDSPGLPNDSAGYPGLGYGLWRTTP